LITDKSELRRIIGMAKKEGSAPADAEAKPAGQNEADHIIALPFCWPIRSSWHLVLWALAGCWR
jgi:hypothetical protein